MGLERRPGRAQPRDAGVGASGARPVRRPRARRVADRVLRERRHGGREDKGDAQAEAGKGRRQHGEQSGEGFTKKNLNRSHAENVAAMKRQAAAHLDKNIIVNRIGVMAAFGCNYQGDIAPEIVVNTLKDGMLIAKETGSEITVFSLADTMGWAAPHRIERVLGEVRNQWPEMEISLHLHDTRGLAVANAYAGLKMGIRRFDTTVGGLGGCPFAGQPKAAGNICTEELVLLCEELGIKTGVNLDRLIEVGRLAEDIVGHQLPGELIHAGSLDAFRRNVKH